uniref:Uncharacterized protein n=1 Tax=Arundo donax TaxID=35708 RepID=A0A0A9ETM6_ARUDO
MPFSISLYGNESERSSSPAITHQAHNFIELNQRFPSNRATI